MSLVLGVDPGQNGAAVLLDGDSVLAAVVWSRLHRQEGVRWRVRSDLPDMATTGTLALAIDTALLMLETPKDRRCWPLDAFVLEGLFVPRHQQRFNPAAVLPLAESVGMWLYALRGGPTPLRPLAREWRPQVLGLKPTTPSEAAEKYALRLSPALFDGWSPPESWTKAERGHAVEAACLARFGQQQLRAEALVREGV